MLSTFLSHNSYHLLDRNCVSVVISSTHWGWVMHICISNQNIIGSDNGLLPGQRQTIIWTNAGILWIGSLGTNFNEIHTFIFTKIHFKMSCGKWRPFCLGPQCVNSFCLSDTMWWHRSGSTLAQVMACCLMAPSHYLNRCWPTISQVWRQSPEDNFTRDSSATN